MVVNSGKTIKTVITTTLGETKAQNSRGFTRYHLLFKNMVLESLK